MMIKKVVYFVILPFCQNEYNRYGIDILRNNGFEVLVYDFSPIVQPLLYAWGVPDPIQYDGHYCFHDKADAFRAISKLSQECFIVFPIHYGRNTFWLYKAISKKALPYGVSYIVNAIPNVLRNMSRRGQLLKRLSTLSFAKIRNLPYKAAVSKYMGVRSPDFVLAGGAESIGNYRASCPLGNRTEILWTHSYDYNIFLQESAQSLKPSGKAVFLDVGVGTGDAIELGIELPSKDKYFPSLCRFLDRVEKETGMEIEIAAHPRSDHTSRPAYFGKRRTIRGDTCNMICQAEFVMTHASTAISFAVLSRKPVIFLITDEYLAKPSFAEELTEMASWLGKLPINIDHDYNVDWERELRVDEAKYKQYKNCFIKKEGTEEMNSWQVLANRIKKL